MRFVFVRNWTRNTPVISNLFHVHGDLLDGNCNVPSLWWLTLAFSTVIYYLIVSFQADYFFLICKALCLIGVGKLTSLLFALHLVVHLSYLGDLPVFVSQYSSGSAALCLAFRVALVWWVLGLFRSFDLVCSWFFWFLVSAWESRASKFLFAALFLCMFLFWVFLFKACGGFFLASMDTYY